MDKTSDNYSKDAAPAVRAGGELLLYPESATLAEFLISEPSRMLLSLAYCLKPQTCPHRQSGQCDLECGACDIARIKQACAERSILFRIETSNDQLVEYLDRNAKRFEWMIGAACPFEVKKLAPLFWERYQLKQLILPRASPSCPSHRLEPQSSVSLAPGAASGLLPLYEVLRSL